MFKALERELTKREVLKLLELSHTSLRCGKEEDFKGLVLGLQDILPFENAMCAHGNVVEILRDSDIEAGIKISDISYPEGYLDEYFQNDDFTSDAVLAELLTNLTPVSWLEVDERCSFNYRAAVSALDYNMRDGWTHGTIDPTSFDLTALFIGGPFKDSSVRSAKILEYVVPFYTQAYNRVLQKKAKPKESLTEREIEVLYWLKEGKSSWDISKILNCSERTVNFHFNNIKAKLGVVNRAQAVATGLQYGIIHF